MYNKYVNKNMFNEDLTLKKSLNQKTNELIITGKFPPIVDTSGIVFSKRIINSNKKVDVICANYDLKKDFKFSTLINNYINKKYVISDVTENVQGIQKFRKEGMKILNEQKYTYEKIHSRSWTMESHFLALDYKLEHDNVKWIAEFSDPLLYDTNNDKRKEYGVVFDDQEYLDKINEQITLLNNTKNYNFPLITDKDSRFFLAEYLPFLFADEIIFTNKNQREIMLSQFPVDIKDYVQKKSKISRHPTLSNEFYHLVKTDYDVDDNFLNFGYFGTFIGNRHIEYLLLAFEMLNDTIKKKIKLHIFSNEDSLIRDAITNSSFKDQIIIGKTVDYLEFLNLTTLMDVLIVNDTITKNRFKINPYLPSKYADYKGSNTKIWALCEKGSPMDQLPVDFKSDLTIFTSTIDTLNEILTEFNIQNNIKINNSEISEYYQDRLTTLNEILYKKFREIEYWKNRCDKAENDIKEKIKIENDKNLKIHKIQEEYNQLHKITKNSFSLVESNKLLINSQSNEIKYYKQKQSIFNRLISVPLSYLYIDIKLPKKEKDITKKLLKKMRNTPWFNKKFYIMNNQDVNKWFWYKLLSPELHYVCYGKKEKRLANNYDNRKFSKKDLIKFLEYN